MNKFVVVAGSYEQFLNWCHDTKTKPRDAIYVSEPTVLMGLRLRNNQIFHTGTYWKRNDIEEIERELMTRLIED